MVVQVVFGEFCEVAHSSRHLEDESLHEVVVGLRSVWEL